MEEKNIPPLSPEENASIWDSVFAQIRKQERKRRTRKRSLLGAVTILLIFASTVWTYNSFFKPDTYIAEKGPHEITLADGTTVTMLRGAKLTVKKSFPAETREVFLKGDALFKVAKSKEHPFIVHGNGYETKVLGTVFKVSQIGGIFKVDLFEGKVLVYKKGQPDQAVRLAPKQTFTNYGIAEAASVSATQGKNEFNSNTRSATLTFKECPVNEAVMVIEKTYGIKVQYSAELINTKITISVPNANADEFIQIVAIQLNLKNRKIDDSTFELEK